MASWTKKVDKLLEEFLDAVIVDKKYHKVYVNPSAAEIDSIAEYISPRTGDNLVDSKEEGEYLRYTAVPEKKVFVFSPYILHPSMDRKFGIDVNKGEFIHGIARKIGGKWTSVEAHSIEHMIRTHKKDEIRKFLNTDWGWLDRYILTTPLIKKFEPQLRRELIEIDKSSRSS